MRSFILLLKIQLLGLFGINKTLHADPAKARRTLALAALAVAAIVLFAAAYSSGVAQALVEMGLPEAVLLVAVLVGAVAGAVAAFLKTNGVLFGFKDYDLVMSLPVPTSSVVLSRIASLYAMSLAFGLLAMVPAFAAVNLVAAGAVLALVVRLFVPVNSLLMLSRPRGTFSFDGKGAAAAKAGSPLRALMAKEARLLVATPIYFMNACIGYVLVLVAAIAVAAGTLTGALSLDLLPPELVPVIGLVLPWGLAFFCSISSTTAASVSLEGSSRWLMLTAPVPASTVLWSKAAVNLAIGLPFLLVSAVLVAVSLPLDALSVAALFAVPSASCLLATSLGLALDARRPRYDWTTVYEPVKRGMPVLVVVFAGMGLVAAGMAAALFLGQAGSLLAVCAVAAASVALYRSTAKRGLSA